MLMHTLFHPAIIIRVPSEDENKISEVETYKSGTTVNRATSPFMVKMATQVEQLPNDPAVKSLVKSIVKFNDVEYQVPTKVRENDNIGLRQQLMSKISMSSV